MILLLIYLLFTTSVASEIEYEYFVSSESTYIIAFETIVRNSSVSSSRSYDIGVQLDADGYRIHYSNVQSMYSSMFVPTMNESYASGQITGFGGLVEPDAFIDRGKYKFQTDSCGYISRIERLNELFITPKITENGPIQRQKIEGHLMVLPPCILAIQEKKQLNNPHLGKLDRFYVERLNDSTIILTKDELMQTQFYSTLPVNEDSIATFFDSTKPVNSFIRSDVEEYYKIVHDENGMSIRVKYFRDATGSGRAYGLPTVRHGVVIQTTIERLSP